MSLTGTVGRRYDSGNRIDFLPYVRLPFSGSSWFVTPQLAWRYTDYSSLDGRPVDNGADSSASRSVPIASLDAGAYFERNMNWGGQDYVQTLEPRLYYLCVPYRDQSNLPLFDTGAVDLQLELAAPRQPFRRRRSPGRRQPGGVGVDHAHPERSRRPRAPARRRGPDNLLRTAPGRTADELARLLVSGSAWIGTLDLP